MARQPTEAEYLLEERRGIREDSGLPADAVGVVPRVESARSSESPAKPGPSRASAGERTRLLWEE